MKKLKWLFSLILASFIGLSPLVALGATNTHTGHFEALEATTSPNEPSLKQQIYRWSHFHDLDPVLVMGIIYCESGFNTKAVGTQAKVGKDIGLLQINTFYHLKESKEKGYDIYKPLDNIRYGLELMKEQGTSPWVKQTHKCLGKLPTQVFALLNG